MVAEYTGEAGSWKRTLDKFHGVSGVNKRILAEYEGVGGLWKKYYEYFPALAGTTSLFKGTLLTTDNRFIAINPATGDLYIATTLGINKVTFSSLSSGGAYTRPWVGSTSVSGDTNANGTSARFRTIQGLHFGSDGNLYASEANRVRKITMAGDVTTLCGPSSTATGYTDATGGSARFTGVTGICEHLGQLYVLEGAAARIRQVTLAGVVTTQRSGLTGITGGFLQADVNGFYLQGTNHTIMTCGASAGDPVLLAGSTQGFADGTGAAAQFSNLWAASYLHPDGYLYVSEGNRVRKVTTLQHATPGVVTLIAGSTTSPVGGTGTTLGTGSLARLNTPQGIAAQSDGSLLVADAGNSRIVRIV